MTKVDKATTMAIHWIYENWVIPNVDIRNSPDRIIDAGLIRNCLNEYWPMLQDVIDQADCEYIAKAYNQYLTELHQ